MEILQLKKSRRLEFRLELMANIVIGVEIILGVWDRSEIDSSYFQNYLELAV